VGGTRFRWRCVTHGLCTIAREIFGKDVDAGRASFWRCSNDAEEVVTGDIPAPVKHHNPGMLKRPRDRGAGQRDLLGMVPAPSARRTARESTSASAIPS